jgi:hypothetical protein
MVEHSPSEGWGIQVWSLKRRKRVLAEVRVFLSLLFFIFWGEKRGEKEEKRKFLLQTVEKENLQRKTVPGKEVELDQKPDLELTTDFRSHRQVAMIEGLTT